MYTYNLFCFGHELAIDHKLNNLLAEYDFYIKTEIGGKVFGVDFPYHGRQCKGDTYSCLFGCEITDSDCNPNFIKEIRAADENDYLEHYNDFLKALKVQADEWTEEWVEDYRDQAQAFKEIVERLFKFLDDNEPCFYTIEVSS